MKAILLLAGVLATTFLLPGQSDEEKALAVFKDHVLHLKNGDFGKAAECLHPKSLKRFKDRALRRFDFEKPEALANRLKHLGYATWEEAEKADPREVYVRCARADKESGPLLRVDTMPRNVESVVGTLAKNGKVYIVAETKFTVDGASERAQAILVVAYKQGDAWKLATYLESDVSE